MKELYLYAMFHANLSFSSIPRSNYAAVIDQCYWPLLDLAKNGHKIGIEFPSSTLLMIRSIDASFIRELAALWHAGACEVLGSGVNQNVMPLIPCEVNMANLVQGMRDYEELLGKRPQLGFINEQTYAAGLPSLYAQAGFKALVMDWDNATEYHHYPPELRYRPVLVEGVDGTLLPIVWNSSLNSYKFQRCVYSRMSVEQYVSEVVVHASPLEARALVLYGTDAELFNYRPITQEETTGEVKKIEHMLTLLKEQEAVHLVTPSEILEVFETVDKVKIETPECPIPCKNRDDYNVLRWAVSGREDTWFNTECYKMYHKIQTISFLSGRNGADEIEQWRDLNMLWSSDLRTKTTNEKFNEGRKKMGDSAMALERKLDYLCSKIEIQKDFVLFNPHNEPWINEPYVVEFHFQEGRFFKRPALAVNGTIVPSQCEHSTRYRDGSIRTLRLVCMPDLGAFEVGQGEFVNDDRELKSTEAVRFYGQTMQIETAAVKLQLCDTTGGDVRSLVFPGISDQPLMGYLSPVYFDHVGHSNDYYSMGIQIIDSERRMINDTKPVHLAVNGTLGHFPIGVPISCRIPVESGIVWKKYFVYHDIPRVDVTYTLYLDNLVPHAFRLGIVTIDPKSFAKQYLKFSTTNGSPHVEQFYVDGKKFHHHHDVDMSTSGQCCLGATEGWIDISDHVKGLSIITEKAELYSVPMVEYEEIKDSYLMRVYTTISEEDETGNILWRGMNRISFTLMGHANGLAHIRSVARHINKKLVCIYDKNKLPYMGSSTDDFVDRLENAERLQS